VSQMRGSKGMPERSASSSQPITWRGLSSGAHSRANPPMTYRNSSWVPKSAISRRTIGSTPHDAAQAGSVM
jgi:hypothetical protein